MNVSTGKFGDADPEMSARIAPNATPPIEFEKLAAQVKQARSKPVVYDSTWLVLECLVNEVARLKTENEYMKAAKQEQKN
jgi:hypothetical protein